MKPELQNKLFKKYPSLFRDKNLSPSQTCMCWGIDTGNGWYDLLDETCYKIMFFNPDNEVVFSQVKEKWGTLRVYYYGGTDDIDKIIDWAEEESYKICEVCGSRLLVNQRRPFGWIHTMCLKCHILYVIRKKFNFYFWEIKYNINLFLKRLKRRNTK